MFPQTVGTIQSILSSPTNVLLLLIVALILSALWSMRIPAHLPRGPRGLPFFGSMFDLADDPLTVISNLTKQYGGIFSVKVGGQRVVVLNDIEYVREALVKKQNDFAGRPWIFSLSVMSEGGEDLIAGNFTSKWKALRKIGNQAIRNYASGHKLERLVKEEVVPRLKTAIEEKNGVPFDPRSLMVLIVTNVIASICFGHNYELDDPEFQNIMKTLDDVNESFGTGLVADFIPILQYLPTKSVRDIKRTLNEWLTLIQTKVDEHKKKEADDVYDLLDDILKIQREAKAAGEDQAGLLTDVNIRQLVSDLFAAGIDAASNTLGWCLIYLIHYPDVQTKVHQEIDEVIGQNRSPLLSDKGKLPYCEAVLQEVMRIRTVLSLAVPHATIRDTSIGEYRLPKGTQVWINLWNLHMNDKDWKEPEEFRPERFLDENGKMLPKLESFLPFSAGRRICIGESLAKNKLFLIFVSLFQQFTFLQAPGQEKPSKSPHYEGLAARCRPYEIVAKERISEETDI